MKPALYIEISEQDDDNYCLYIRDKTKPRESTIRTKRNEFHSLLVLFFALDVEFLTTQ